jgi:dTDP-4-dehydrorhamnose reductase
MTKYEMCKVMGDVAGVQINHITQNVNLAKAAARPNNVQLSTEKIVNAGVIVDFADLKNGSSKFFK